MAQIWTVFWHRSIRSFQQMYRTDFFNFRKIYQQFPLVCRTRFTKPYEIIRNFYSPDSLRSRSGFYREEVTLFLYIYWMQYLEKLLRLRSYSYWGTRSQGQDCSPEMQRYSCEPQEQSALKFSRLLQTLLQNQVDSVRMVLISSLLLVVSKIFSYQNSLYNLSLDPQSNKAISMQSFRQMSNLYSNLAKSGFFFVIFLAYFYAILQISSRSVPKTRQKYLFLWIKCASLAYSLRPDSLIFLQASSMAAEYSVCFSKQIFNCIFKGRVNLSTTIIATSLYSSLSSSQPSLVAYLSSWSLLSQNWSTSYLKETQLLEMAMSSFGEMSSQSTVARSSLTKTESALLTSRFILCRCSRLFQHGMASQKTSQMNLKRSVTPYVTKCPSTSPSPPQIQLSSTLKQLSFLSCMTIPRMIFQKLRKQPRMYILLSSFIASQSQESLTQLLTRLSQFEMDFRVFRIYPPLALPALESQANLRCLLTSS